MRYESSEISSEIGRHLDLHKIVSQGDQGQTLSKPLLEVGSRLNSVNDEGENSSHFECDIEMACKRTPYLGVV